MMSEYATTELQLDEKHYRRFWILSLLSGIEDAGCSPIDLYSFNILAYIANAVSQCYGIPTLSSTILKERDGPLYPQLIWELDRLVGVGLVNVKDIVVDKQNSISHASYSINRSGLRLEDSCRNLNARLVIVGDSLRSASLAYCRNRIKLSSASLNALDGNYANTQFANGEVIDFGDWNKVNATANAIEEVLNELSISINSSSDKARTSIGVNLYSAYLASFDKTSSVKS